jgi:hypothetical protein
MVCPGCGAPTGLAGRVLDLLSARIDGTFHHRWNPNGCALNLHACLVLDDADHLAQFV